MTETKRSGFTEKQYIEICREFDLKWEKVKYHYGVTEKQDAPKSTIQPGTN